MPTRLVLYLLYAKFLKSLLNSIIHHAFFYKFFYFIYLSNLISYHNLIFVIVISNFMLRCLNNIVTFIKYYLLQNISLVFIFNW